MSFNVFRAVILCGTCMTVMYADTQTNMHFGEKHEGSVSRTNAWSLTEISEHNAKKNTLTASRYHTEQLERSLEHVGNDDECGIAPVFSNARIVNGNSSEIGEWPWQVMILSYAGSTGLVGRICGGTLISNQWILTAAHCIEYDVTSYFLVVLGEYYSDLSSASASREIRAIGSISCHESYSPTTVENDICLIKLVSPVSYNDYIVPACLPVQGDSLEAGERCIFTGWGETQGSGNSDVLQEANVEIISRSKCAEWWMEVNVTVHDTNICAGDNGSVTGCYGDSGGPLVCKRSIRDASRYVLYGITSFGLKDCVLHHERPTVFADASKYLSWINTTVTKAPDTSECFIQSTAQSCGSRYIRESGSIIRTPYLDTDLWVYPPNMNCEWDIRAPVGSYISLQFMCFFHVEARDSAPSNQCPNDIMIIRSENAGLNHGYCGVFEPSELDRVIQSNEATIIFRSDSSQATGGFVVRVTFVDVDGFKTTESVTTTESTGPTKGVLSTTSSAKQNSQAIGYLLLVCVLSGMMTLFD